MCCICVTPQLFPIFFLFFSFGTDQQSLVRYHHVCVCVLPLSVCVCMWALVRAAIRLHPSQTHVFMCLVGHQSSLRGGRERRPQRVKTAWPGEPLCFSGVGPSPAGGVLRAQGAELLVGGAISIHSGLPWPDPCPVSAEADFPVICPCSDLCGSGVPVGCTSAERSAARRSTRLRL